MILPVPYAETINLHDLSNYKEIFVDCAKHFHSATLQSMMYNSRSENSSNTLKVYQCGSYNVSIVLTLKDFDYLDPNYFKLNDNVSTVLSTHYNKDFGFIVCKLRTGNSEKYHPIAYSHKIYKTNMMFVPTRHHHSKNEESVSKYDHNIYSINTKSLCGSEKWDHKFRLQTTLIPDFVFPEILCFNKLVIKKKDINKDLTFCLDSYVESFGQHHGVGGCIFKTNHPCLTFKNRGSVYTHVLFRGLPFFNDTAYNAGNQSGSLDNLDGLSFDGNETVFIVMGNKIKVIDDVGTKFENTMYFKFNPRLEVSKPGIYLTNKNQVFI